MNALTWSPTIDCIRRTLASEGHLRLIVSPFIKLQALRALIRECKDTSQLQVVVRWQPSDLLNGATDPSIYPFLRDKGIPLFRHKSIHLKLFVFNRSLAFHTSGNVTSRGLGLVPRGNLEIGCLVTLKADDWTNLFGLLSLSEEIDDQMFQQAQQFVEENRHLRESLPPMNLYPAKKKEFSTQSLPACESPQLLYKFYSDKLFSADDWLDESPEFIHDLLLYSVPPGLNESHFYSTLEKNFMANSFTKSMVNYLRSQGSISFGAVTAWLANTCADSPRPYRRDLKTITRHLYNWLAFFYSEISWKRPKYSMVLYWND